MELRGQKGLIMGLFSRAFQTGEEYSSEIACSEAEIKTMEKVQEECYRDMMASQQIEDKKKFMQTPLGK